MTMTEVMTYFNPFEPYNHWLRFMFYCMSWGFATAYIFDSVKRKQRERPLNELREINKRLNVHIECTDKNLDGVWARFTIARDALDAIEKTPCIFCRSGHRARVAREELEK